MSLLSRVCSLSFPGSLDRNSQNFWNTSGFRLLTAWRIASRQSFRIVSWERTHPRRSLPDADAGGPSYPSLTEPARAFPLRNFEKAGKRAIDSWFWLTSRMTQPLARRSEAKDDIRLSSTLRVLWKIFTSLEYPRITLNITASNYQSDDRGCSPL